MDTLSFLKQIRSLTADVSFREREIEALRAQIEGLGSMRYENTRVKSARTEDRIDALIDLIDSRIAAHTEAIVTMHETVADVSAQIARLEDINEVVCLTLRYVQLMPWREISEAMGISERHLRRIRDRGVAHLDLIRNGGQTASAG